MSGIFLKDLLASLIHGKLRTVFAVLGIVFGVSSLVLIVSAIKGSTLQARKVIERLGPDSVLIVSGAIGKGPRGRTRNLSLDDVRDISKLEGIYALTYGIVKPMMISNTKTSKFSAVFGVGKNWLKSWDYRVEMGRGFSPDDFKNMKKVAVVGHDVSDFLYPNENPIGKIVLIGKVPFRIIGVYKKKGKTPNGHNLDNRVFISYDLFDRVVDKTYGKVSVIRFRVVDINRYQQILKETKQILLKRHRKDEFTIITPVVVKKFLSMMSATFALFLGIASTTALVVGGFVLSSIFYINVKVREWEIGLRRALGATKRAVLWRILSESIVIAIISVILGTFVGFASVKYVLPALKIPVVYPVEAFFIAAFFSLLVCMLAAYFPSKKAAELDPITSLRRKV
ncbi:putative ABC transport system permease protein [Desulfurobacterium pacificum]|uniref:ABC transport system permease protein n=1 Tax=Desulfurobacterium pacificum TaxID=240166 RepID=A0ABY1N889_9BACT|nr:ABC transporter permease [Desulfurobacterium pacificum]SMP02863.1 putative ABC transport system permease protein [Desulfurobacterium pacificum]